MESGCQEVTAPDQSREAIARGQRLDARSDRPDARRANENHLQWAACKRGGRRENCRIDLPAIGVALHRDVECAEGWLGRRFNVPGEQDGPGAGAEGWRAADIILEKLEEPAALEELEHGGRLAARQDQAWRPPSCSGVRTSMGSAPTSRKRRACTSN